ncbi:hypothetical protein OQA88_8338 [Cercophora sp. LCS_1]
MRFLNVLLGLAAVGSAVAAPAVDDTPTPTIKRASKFQWVGTNQAGAEFGNKEFPGTLGKHYTWPDLIGKGFNTFRIAFMMERLVPNKLNGPLDPAYSKSLQDIVQYVTSKGAYAVLDPHNFGRYYEKVITDVEGFGAWWSTVAKLFATNEKVIWDTNNEYHDVPSDLVLRLNQAAIDAIRKAGATSQYIWVEGNAWTGAWTWTTTSGNTNLINLKDPSDKIIYEMHQYLDTDGSGTNANCVSSTIGVERIREATNWLKQNKKKGVIGEVAGGANAQCITALQGMLKYMQDNSDVWTGWVWWAGGPWWADYMFSIEPPSGTAYTKVLPSLLPYI